MGVRRLKRYVLEGLSDVTVGGEVLCSTDSPGELSGTCM